MDSTQRHRDTHYTSPQPPPKEGEFPLLRRGRRVRCSGLKAQNILAWGNALRYENNKIAGQARNDGAASLHKWKKIVCNAIIFLFLMNSHTFGQDTKKYTELVQEAINFYKSKEYLKSGQKYNEAFIAFGGKGIISDRYRYNAACSWALANESDSAFIQLFHIAENHNYTNIEYITKDTDLNSLHKDERWSILINIIINNEAKLDKILVTILDTIYKDDQKYRLEINNIREQYGGNSDEMKAHWKIIRYHDSINKIKVTKILDERGWLGADIIGRQGNTTLFLVIQHSDLETQEKYLPMMREAAKNGNASPINLAYLEDRVALKKGEKQIYGTQFSQIYTKTEQGQDTVETYVRPLIDPDNVDKRRAEVGLGSIHDVMFKNYGLTWDVEEYKRKLPEYEEKEWGKKQNENKEIK